MSVWLSGRRVCQANALKLEAKYLTFASSTAEGALPSPACSASSLDVIFPPGCSCTLFPPPSLHHFPSCYVPWLQPGTFLQRNASFSQKTCQVVKINLRACRELLTRKCLTISPKAACRNALSWLMFIHWYVSGVYNLGT